MPIDELSTRADAILRGRVVKVEKARYLGTYTQLATLEVTDIIKGDSRMKEVKVWGGSQIVNANDFLDKGLVVLVFLVREQTFFRTLNYQYGQFLIEGETVKGWRLPGGAPVEPPPTPNGNSTGAPQTPPQPNDFRIEDRNYGDVRREVIDTIRLARQFEG